MWLDPAARLCLQESPLSAPPGFPSFVLTAVSCQEFPVTQSLQTDIQQPGIEFQILKSPTTSPEVGFCYATGSSLNSVWEDGGYQSTNPKSFPYCHPHPYPHPPQPHKHLEREGRESASPILHGMRVGEGSGLRKIQVLRQE